MAEKRTGLIGDSIEGNSIHAIKLDQLKRRMYAGDDGVFSFRARFPHLERIENLSMPGAPDEAWRRIDFSEFPLDELAIAAPQVSVGGEGGRPVPAGVVVGRSGAESAEAFRGFASRFGELANRRSGRVRDRANDVRENRLESINEALATRPILIRAESAVEGAVVVIVDGPPEAEGGLTLPQILVHATAGARAHVIVVLRNGGTTIARTKTVVDDGASLRLSTIVSPGTRFLHDTALVDRDGRLYLGYLAADGDPAMIESSVTLAGEGAESTVHGLSLGAADHFTGQKLTVEHIAAYTRSSTRWHSVLRDSARSLFVGNIAIPRGSRGSVGFEESHSLLLSRTARAESIPQLEIIENDVECSHGATVSGLDPESVYYLRSRGIPMDQVERLLTSAFCRTIIDPMDLPSDVYSIVKEAISDEVDISDDT